MARLVSHRDLKSYFGEEDLLEKARNASFPAMIFELLSEKKPSDAELELFELILNISIDHGPETPSAVETIQSAHEGKTISESVASGILQIGDVHGGAAEPLMRELYDIEKCLRSSKQMVEGYLDEGKRLPGFGHRIYKDADPRAQLILGYTKIVSGGGRWVELGREVEKELSELSGKQLPINIDGAIAVALCALGFEPRLGKAVFIIARTPGLCGWYLQIFKI